MDNTVKGAVFLFIGMVIAALIAVISEGTSVEQSNIPIYYEHCYTVSDDFDDFSKCLASAGLEIVNKGE